MLYNHLIPSICEYIFIIFPKCINIWYTCYIWPKWLKCAFHMLKFSKWNWIWAIWKKKSCVALVLLECAANICNSYCLTVRMMHNWNHNLYIYIVYKYFVSTSVTDHSRLYTFFNCFFWILLAFCIIWLNVAKCHWNWCWMGARVCEWFLINDYKAAGRMQFKNKSG